MVIFHHNTNVAPKETPALPSPSPTAAPGTPKTSTLTSPCTAGPVTLLSNTTSSNPTAPITLHLLLRSRVPSQSTMAHTISCKPPATTSPPSTTPLHSSNSGPSAVKSASAVPSQSRYVIPPVLKYAISPILPFLTCEDKPRLPRNVCVVFFFNENRPILMLGPNTVSSLVSTTTRSLLPKVTRVLVRRRLLFSKCLRRAPPALFADVNNVGDGQ